MFQLSDIDATKTINLKSFDKILDYDTSEYQQPLIRWDGTSEYCALDIDKIPENIDCYVLTRLIKPTPKWAWVTRSNHGLRAIYHTDRGLAADELAALALWFLMDKIPEIKVEFLNRTFYPTEKALIVRNPRQEIDQSFFDKFLTYSGEGINDDTVRSWLSERGMEIGKRYAHSNCPLHPERTAERNPVLINDGGIYCFVCAATEKSGYRRWDQIINRRSESPVGVLVENKTHWEHAKYILERLTGLTGSVCKKLYGASLVYRHGKAIRDESVFRGTTNCIRIGSWWGTQAGEVYGDDIKPLLAGLPACRYTNAKGQVKTDETKLTRLAQTADINELGYPALDIIRGMRLYGHFLTSNGENPSIVTQAGYLRKDEYASFRPKYVDGVDQLKVEEAKKRIEQVFPKLDWYALYLILAARGTAEGMIGLPSFVYISGPSGSGKTSLIKIAAAMLGDYHTEHVWTNNPERVRQGILNGKQNGLFVSFDEICKNAKKAKVDFTVAMDDALNLTPDSTSHQLYIGPVKLGVLPAIFWTDTEVPNELRESVQLGRRIIHCRLLESMDWEPSLYASGVDQIPRLRIADPELTEACDVILSDIINRFFREKRDLKTIAKELGYDSLLAEGTTGRYPLLKEFFDAVCDAPELFGTDAKRWRGEGWKLIELNANTPIAQAWDIVQSPDNPKESRACSEANWTEILNLKGPIEFELQSHGTKLAVRFIRRKRDEGIRTNRGLYDGTGLLSANGKHSVHAPIT